MAFSQGKRMVVPNSSSKECGRAEGAAGRDVRGCGSQQPRETPQIPKCCQSKISRWKKIVCPRTSCRACNSLLPTDRAGPPPRTPHPQAPSSAAQPCSGASPCVPPASPDPAEPSEGPRAPGALHLYPLPEVMARSRRAFTSQISQCALCPLQQIWQCWDAPERCILRHFPCRRHCAITLKSSKHSVS